MEKKALLRLLLILLGLSYVVFVAAVPATRSLVARKVDPSVQDHLAKEDLDLKFREEVFGVEEGALGGRMMMDMIADYPKPGANHAHDPKSPGKPRA